MTKRLSCTRRGCVVGRVQFEVEFVHIKAADVLVDPRWEVSARSLPPMRDLMRCWIASTAGAADMSASSMMTAEGKLDVARAEVWRLQSEMATLRGGAAAASSQAVAGAPDWSKALNTPKMSRGVEQVKSWVFEDDADAEDDEANMTTRA